MLTFNQGVVQPSLLIHPQEEEARNALMKNHLFIGLCKDVASLKLELSAQAQNRLNNYLVTEHTSPRVYYLYRQALKAISNGYSTIDTFDQVYPLFVKLDHAIRADVSGSEKKGYMICITSGALESLTDSELLALLGQALGHIRTGHVQYMECLQLMKDMLDKLPVLGKLAANQMWTNFAHWQYYADYTADRIGAITAGSIEAVVSLLCKQIGATLPGQTPLSVINNQRPLSIPSASLYLVWMAQEQPAFNAIGRMHELRRWSQEQDFCNNLPYMYYCARAFFGDSPKNAQEKNLIQLHGNAAAGDIQNIAYLGECYLRGLEGLPGKSELGYALTRYAALHGNGGAMYLMYLCANVGIRGVTIGKSLSHQLLRAAASRCEAAKNDAAELARPLRLEGITGVLMQMEMDLLRFAFNRNNPGEAIPENSVKQLKDVFLLPADSKVFAYEIKRRHGQYSGIVIADTGIYGRLEDEDMPFAVEWKEYMVNHFTMGEALGRRHLYSGKRKLYRVIGDLKNSMAELLVNLCSALQNR